MRVQEFVETLPLQYNDWGTDRCSPKDLFFSQSIAGIWGMIVPNKMQLIRHACSFLGPGEIYLEAGVLHGMSMICATKDNAVQAVGIDNWSQFPTDEGNSNACKRALREAGVADRVTLIEQDVKRVLVAETFPPVGVYHYDANHDFFETLFSLELGYPHLAKQAVIIVDDAAWPSPREAVDRFLNRYQIATSEHGAAKMIFDMKGADYQGVWTTGMVVLQWMGI